MRLTSCALAAGLAHDMPSSGEWGSLGRIAVYWIVTEPDGTSFLLACLYHAI